MSLVHLNVPVLLQQRDGRFVLRPLLLAKPRVVRARYGDAEQAFRKALVERYKERDLDRRDLDDLLWYGLDDGLQFELLQLSFKSGMQQIDGLFALVRLTIKGREYLCLPMLDSLWAVVPEHAAARDGFIDFVQELVQGFLRRQRREPGADHLDWRSCVSRPGDSLVEIAVDLQLRPGRFAFERPASRSFNFLQRDQSIDGAVELERVGEDWNGRYPHRLGVALFRDAEQERLSQSIFFDPPTATVLVAPTGGGKTNLVESLVRRGMEQDPRLKAHKRVKLWLVDPLRVISGMSVVGQWERRWEAILEALCERLQNSARIDRPDVLYLDNPVALLNVGKTSQSSLTLAHLLKPYLQARRLPCLLEATPQQWQRVQELDRGFADLFQVLRLNPLSDGQVLEVLVRGRARLESEQDCRIDTAALSRLLLLEPQFRGDRALPGSALSALAQMAQRHQGGYADEASAYALFEAGFHFRRAIIDRDQPLRADRVAGFFAERLVGQDAARAAMVDLVLRIKAHLTPPGRPLCSMLLIGPTGVGKTESAKLLAEFLFEREECLVRIDLNEYGDASAVARLIGERARPNGVLTERVRYQRACVLLLDEIEKAHPKVHDLLLQLLDDGRLTDALGRTTDFSQTLVVMTSNLGARAAAKVVGFTQEQSDGAATYRQAVERFFRPELLNRIERLVVFEPLAREHMQQLAALHLGKLVRRDGFARRRTMLRLDGDVLERLGQAGFDAQMGARALKRSLESRITGLIAEPLAMHAGNEPVILRLKMRDDDLTAAVTPLRFAPARAAAPRPDLQLSDYRAIAARLRHMDETLTRATPVGAPGYANWTLSARIRDILEPLQAFVWDREELVRVGRLEFGHFRLSGPRLSRNLWRENRVDTAALLAHADVRDYLNGLYQAGEACFTKEQSYQVHLHSALRWLQAAYGDLAQGDSPRGTLILRSLLPGQGARALDFLAGMLRRLILDLGTLEDERAIHDGLELHYLGPGLRALGEAEQGIHLFIEERNAQVPIVLTSRSDMENPDQLKEPDTIVRLYALPHPGGERRDGSITDLRSGMQVGSTLDLEDLRLLVAGELPPFDDAQPGREREDL